MQEGTGWHKDVLALPGCAPGLDEAARLVWQALLNGNGLCLLSSLLHWHVHGSCMLHPSLLESSHRWYIHGMRWHEVPRKIQPCCMPIQSQYGLLRYGPRVRMGLYEGVPTSVRPHSTSGRCDYWGPFVNRAARFSNAAAHGGQILVPAAVGQALVLALTKRQLSLEAGEAVHLVHPDFVPHKLQPAAPGLQTLAPQRSGSAVLGVRSREPAAWAQPAS